MRIHYVAQRSTEWLALHVGRVTSSRALHVHKERQKEKHKGDLEGRSTLRRQLVSEELTGLCSDEIGPFVPRAMQRGIELEPLAFATYEAITALPVSRVGFIEHDELKAGCSPDGVVFAAASDARADGDDIVIDVAIEGGIELKCPDSDTHLSYWQAGGVPEIYLPQILHCMFVTGAQWWDFVSFDDRFIDPALRLYRVRVERASVDLAAYEAKLKLFLEDVDNDYRRACRLPADVAAHAESLARLAEVL